MRRPFVPAGVIPAALMAFTDDFAIDERWARKHLADLAAVDGLTGITVNGHASEVHACDPDEQRRILEFSLAEVGDRLPLINGVYADGSFQAARIARMAADAGASALLVFPPQPLALGGARRPEMVIEHFRRIADATDLPLIFFQYPHHGPLHTPFETVLRLVEAVPTIRAMKDWCHDGRLHERNIRVLQALPRPVAVLTTHSAWLLGSLAMGAAGLLSGAGSVMAELQVRLFRAVQRGDLAEARAVADRVFPLAQAFYDDPFLDMHNRMKEANVLLGRLPRAVVRPPLMKLPRQEIDRLRVALVESGLLAPAEVAHGR